MHTSVSESAALLTAAMRMIAKVRTTIVSQRSDAMNDGNPHALVLSRAPWR
jgi:hypothetical protein